MRRRTWVRTFGSPTGVGDTGMGWAELMTPALWAGALGAAAVRVRSHWTWERLPSAAGFLTALLLGVALMFGVTQGPWTITLGVGALVASLGAALRGVRQWSRGRLLLSGARHRLEDVLPQGTPRLAGIFEGRMSTQVPVTSPGGVVCAFYRAEIRRMSPTGARGPLVSTESGFSGQLVLCSESGDVRVRFSPKAVVGRAEIRRCRVSAPPYALEPAWILDAPHEEALSYELVGRMGESCRVVGELRQGPWGASLTGPEGGPALVLLGDGVLAVGQRLRREGGAWLGGSVLACIASAVLLAGAL